METEKCPDARQLSSYSNLPACRNKQLNRDWHKHPINTDDKAEANALFSRRRISHRKCLAHDPYYQSWDYSLRNPRGLVPTADWFRLNPDRACRIVWFNGVVTFYPRSGGVGIALLAEQIRHAIAEQNITGTPLERLRGVFEWLKRNGAFTHA